MIGRTVALSATAALVLAACGQSGSSLSSDPMLEDAYESVDLTHQWEQTIGGGAFGTFDSVNSEFQILPPADPADAVREVVARATTLGWDVGRLSFGSGPIGGERDHQGERWTEDGDRRQLIISHPKTDKIHVKLADVGQPIKGN